MSSNKKSLLASGLSLSFFTLCSRVLGLVREMTKASFLGTSIYADAFGIAFMIPNLLRRLFAENSISVAFIPTFRGYLEDKSEKETKAFISATLTLISFCTSIVVITGILITPYIIPFFYDGTNQELLRETVILTRIMFPYLIVISVAALFQGILNGVKIFSPSGFTPVLFNTIVISLTYILAPYTANPARAMAYGVISGGCMQALFQLPFVIKTGWATPFSSIKKAFTNPGTKKVMALIGPTVIGMAAYQLNDVVSTALAGKAGTGVLSSLQYSLRLQELILGIFAVSIGTVILPDLSRHAKNKDWNNFNEMLIQAIRIIALISIPVTGLSLLCGRDIISLVYKSRSFDDLSVTLTLTAFNYHIAGLFFIAVNRIVSPAFYARGNTKLPTIAGIIGFGVNITLALILIKPMAGGGIALALTLASLANTVLLFAFLKKSPELNVSKLIKETVLYSVKMIIYSAAACIPSYFVLKAVHPVFEGNTRILAYGVPFVLTSLTFAFTGVVLLFITGDPVYKAIINIAKSKLNRR